MGPAKPALIFSIASLLLGTGCDTGIRTDQLSDTPALHVEQVLVATSLDNGVLQYAPLAADGSTKVISTTSFKLQLDRLLLPITATRQALCVQPKLGPVHGLGDCQLGVFLEPTYDPALREVVFRQRPDLPPLLNATAYQLTAYVALEDTASGLRTFDGVPLGAPVSFEFTVAPDPGGVIPPYETLPQGDHFCGAPDPSCSGDQCARPVAAVLGAAGCSTNLCHGGSAAAEDLNMSTPTDLLAGAIGHVAHETETGEHANEPEQTPSRFGRAMPILAPQVPGNSYLVYKLLANKSTPLVRPFAPDPSDPNGDPPEVRRLRNTVIVGMPMPPLEAPAAALRPGEIEWISEWLMQGAPVGACK